MPPLGKRNFKEIYTHYFKRSFLFVKSYVFDDMIAEDIVSDCMISTWQHAQQITIANLDAYLHTLLKNRVLNYLKHERIKYTLFSKIKDEQVEELSLRINTLESCFPQQVLTGEIQRIVRQTLDQVSSQSKEIFTQSRFHGKTNQEIASMMNLTIKSVEYHITKVLKLLRMSLKDYLLGFVFALAEAVENLKIFF